MLGITHEAIIMLAVGFISFFLAVALLWTIGDLLIDRFDRAHYMRAAEAELKKGQLAIGYKYANIGKEGFLGLRRGEPYGVNSDLGESTVLEQAATGFHSYSDLGMLQQMSSMYPGSDRGTVILEVLHYGKLIEYQDGWVSTGQRILQIAPADSVCGRCTAGVKYAVVFPDRGCSKFCQRHYYLAQLSGLAFFPGTKAVNLAKWLKSFGESDEGKLVKVNETLNALVPTEKSKIEA